VSSEFPPYNPYGGLSTYTCITAKALAAAGHEIHILTWAFCSEYKEFGREVKFREGRLATHVMITSHFRIHQRALMWLPHRAKALKEVRSIDDLDVIQCADISADGICLWASIGFPFSPSEVGRIMYWNARVYHVRLFAEAKKSDSGMGKRH